MASRASQAAVAALQSASLRPSFKARLSQGSRAAALWGMHSDEKATNMWHTRARIHPSAVVDPSAAVDEDAVVGPMCIVGPGVVIGAGSKLLSHCVVSRNTIIGDGCELHPFSCVGGDPQDKKFAGEATWLLMGSHCVVREHVTINLGTAAGGSFTRIGERCLVMSGVHVGHDCVLGDGAVISTSAGLAGHVEVGEGAIVGGQCGIKQRVRIGAGAMVGGKSAVIADVLPYTLVSGNPAVTHGLNLVGLRRRGTSREEIRALQTVLRFILAGEEHGQSQAGEPGAGASARASASSARGVSSGGVIQADAGLQLAAAAAASSRPSSELDEQRAMSGLAGSEHGGVVAATTVQGRAEVLEERWRAGRGGEGGGPAMAAGGGSSKLVREMLGFLKSSNGMARVCLPTSGLGAWPHAPSGLDS